MLAQNHRLKNSHVQFLNSFVSMETGEKGVSLLGYFTSLSLSVFITLPLPAAFWNTSGAFVGLDQESSCDLYRGTTELLTMAMAAAPAPASAHTNRWKVRSSWGQRERLSAATHRYSCASLLLLGWERDIALDVCTLNVKYGQTAKKKNYYHTFSAITRNIQCSQTSPLIHTHPLFLNFS